MNNEVREAFEKWVLGRGWSVDRSDEGVYRGAVIEVAWDAWRKAESDSTKRLQGEAGVMRQLLRIALGIIENCYPDDSTEAEMMQDLESQIKAVLKAST